MDSNTQRGFPALRISFSETVGQQLIWHDAGTSFGFLVSPSVGPTGPRTRPRHHDQMPTLQQSILQTEIALRYYHRAKHRNFRTSTAGSKFNVRICEHVELRPNGQRLGRSVQMPQRSPSCWLGSRKKPLWRQTSFPFPRLAHSTRNLWKATTSLQNRVSKLAADEPLCVEDTFLSSEMRHSNRISLQQARDTGASSNCHSCIGHGN